MFSNPDTWTLFTTLTSEFILAIGLGIYLVLDVKRKQKAQ
jgi:hypothetical protein